MRPHGMRQCLRAVGLLWLALVAASAHAQPVVTPGTLSRTSASTADSSPITFTVGFSGAARAVLNASEVLLGATGSVGQRFISLLLGNLQRMHE